MEPLLKLGFLILEHLELQLVFLFKLNDLLLQRLDLVAQLALHLAELILQCLHALLRIAQIDLGLVKLQLQLLICASRGLLRRALDEKRVPPLQFSHLDQELAV